jgi:hypothetical protein
LTTTVISLSFIAGSAPSTVGADAPDRGAATSPVRQAAGPVDPRPRCRSARLAVPYYRLKTHDRQRDREARELADRTPIVRGKSCRWSRFAAGVHQARARAALRSLERWQKLVSTVKGAICHEFREYCSQALTVSWCESKHLTTAANGQYLGLFQMGESERRLFGHGDAPLEQARAARRYFDVSGRDWSPWQCSPYGGLAW